MGTEQLVEFLSHKIPCWNDDCSAIIRSQHVAGDVFFENSKEDWMHYGFILVYALRLTKLQNIILSGQSAGASGGGIPVDGDDEDGIDAFLTHDWGKGDENNGRDNHAEVAAVNTALKQRGIRTWFDQDRMEGVITKQMQQGIDRAATVVTFITKRYMSKVDGDNEKDNCQREFLYAQLTKPEAMIAVPMHQDCSHPGLWKGPVLFTLGSKLAAANVVDGVNSANFKAQMDALASEIRRVMKLVASQKSTNPRTPSAQQAPSVPALNPQASRSPASVGSLFYNMMAYWLQAPSVPALNPPAASRSPASAREPPLKVEATSDEVNSLGESLYIAARAGQAAEVERLLQSADKFSNGSAIVHWRKKDNLSQSTPLHTAAYFGHSDVVKQLMQAGADINAEDRIQRTPLHCATINGHSDVVKQLIQAGADINAKDCFGKTPLNLAEGNKETTGRNVSGC
eukprot:JP446163.1.p1 GENE.JP446163.1~~JP446163.1.p1  ORF type:complete len:486 (+),score=101.85 JP446163.1:91-1458(+)